MCGFIWRERWGRIPVKSSLLARGVNILSFECSMCVGMDETLDHILSNCPFARRVWGQFDVWRGVSLDGVSGIRDFKEISKQEVRRSAKKKAISFIVMATCWLIWLERNEGIFNDVSVSVQGMLDKIKIHSSSWLKNWANLVDLVWHK